MSNNCNKTVYLKIVILICLFARIIWLLALKPWDPVAEQRVLSQDDAGQYYHYSEVILGERTWTEKLSATLKVPLYPVFIALIFKHIHHSVFTVLLIQILLSTFTCMILQNAFMRLFSFKVALLASLCYAFDPQLIYYNLTLLSETLHLFFMAIAFFGFSVAITAADTKSKYLGYCLFSIYLGLSALTKVISQYIWVFILFYIIYVYRHSIREIVKISLVFLLLYFSVLLPWAHKNYQQYGDPALSTMSMYNLLYFCVGAQISSELKTSHHDTKKILDEELKSMAAKNGLDYTNLNPFQQSKYQKGLAFKYMSDNPLMFGKKYSAGILNIFLNINLRGYKHFLSIPESPLQIKGYYRFDELIKTFLKGKYFQDFFFLAIMGAFMFAVYSGALIGLIVSFNLYSKNALLMCVICGVYFTVTVGTGGFVRHKIPIMLYYLPFVGIGFEYILNKVFLRSIFRKVI